MIQRYWLSKIGKLFDLSIHLWTTNYVSDIPLVLRKSGGDKSGIHVPLAITSSILFTRPVKIFTEWLMTEVKR